MPDSCLVGCIRNYTNGGANPISYLEDAHVMSPYVRVFFLNGSSSLTVGNNSSPAFGNTAAIKSFNFSISDGLAVKFEIIDEQGSEFHKFAEKLNKCLGNTIQDYQMAFQFGWIPANCDNSIMPLISSPVLVAQPHAMDTSFENGKIRFTIHGNECAEASEQTKPITTYGSEDVGGKMHIKDAIRKLCRETDPKFDVEFRRLEKDGTINEWHFKEDPKDKVIIGSWKTDGQGKLSSIMKWIEPFKTDRDKGVYFTWAILPEEKPPKLIIMEDRLDNCDVKASDDGPLMTYIVNGGKCSRVTSFSPTINWQFLRAAEVAKSGGTGGTGTGESVITEKECPNEVIEGVICNSPETGLAKSVTESSTTLDIYGPSRARKETSESSAEHQKAIQHLESVVSVDMQIQGDPRREFCVPGVNGQYIAVIVVNPFNIVGSGNNNCGTWLATPGCNSILSSKKWLILGAVHDIREGSYVTTLNLNLAPKDINFDDRPSSVFSGPGGF